MILDDKNSEIKNNLMSEDSEFTIEASSKMFDLLSSKIYEDPIRAIVRELSCNAIDANIDAKNNDIIKIYLPTQSNPTFKVEDSGIGMTHEDVMTVYRSYGKSTKTGSNKVIGALGLGGKTPLAYTSQFTLVTSKDGTKNSYIIYRDDNGIPNVNRVHSEDSDNTGTSVELIVKAEDTNKFYRAAIKTFLFFEKMPEIMRGEDTFFETLKSGFFSDYLKTKDEIKIKWLQARNLVAKDYINIDNTEAGGEIVRKVLRDYDAVDGVVMGQIFYSVNPKQICDSDKYGSDADFIQHFPITTYGMGAYKIYHIPMGSVSIQPSREALNYNKSTIQFLTQKFNSDFEIWADNIKKNYGTAQLFLKNFSKIPYANQIKAFECKGSCKDRTVQELNMIQKGLVKEFFKNVWNDKSNFFHVEKNYKGIYKINKLNRNASTRLLTEDSHMRNLFNEIFFENKIKNIVILDVPEMANKLCEFSDKAAAKGNNSFTSPIALKNRLNIKDINYALIMDENIANILSKNFSFDVVKISEITLPKEEKEEKEYKQRKAIDRSGKCYDYIQEKYVDDALKVAKRNYVTYELFEGDIHSRGWYFSPRFDKIKNDGLKGSKNNFIEVHNHGVWSGCQYDVFKKIVTDSKKCGFDITVPKAHYLIDWNYFKNNDIINNSHFVFINEYVAKQFFVEITHYKQPTSVIYGETICGKELADCFINAGKGITGYNQIDFFKEMERIVQERSIPETSISDIGMAFKRTYQTYGEFCKPCGSDSLRLAHESNQKKLISLKEENDKLGTIRRVDYATAMYQKYPMLKYVMNKHNSNGYFEKETVNNIIAYIKLVEGIS